LTVDTNTYKPDQDKPDDGISPLLSRAPPLLSSTADPISQHPDSPLRTPNSALDDAIPPEHKRIPGLIPRSPLSPPTTNNKSDTAGIGLGLGFRSLSRKNTNNNSSNDAGTTGRSWRGRRKPVPPPIVVVHPPRENWGFKEVKSPAVESVKGTIVVASPGSGSASAGMSPGGLAPAVEGTPARGKSKRRTVWGMIEGWWDLGLLERMGTVRRRK
jgi:hypothetical protein